MTLVRILQFLIEIACTLMGAALLIRAWMFAVRMPPFNPLGQAIFRGTEWCVAPLRKIFPHKGKIEWSALIAAWLMAIIYLALLWLVYNSLLTLHFLMPNPLAFVVQSLVTLVRWALNLIVWLTLIQAILSWVNPAAPMMGILQTLTAPLLNPIRRILPSSTIDFSPLVLLIIAQILLMVVSDASFGGIAF